MQSRFGAYFLFALIAAPIASASASGMPDIKSGPRNAVPECVTPGRLLAFLKSRNPELDRRFESLPGEYMRLGEDLGVRWDYAFYQMVLETGALSFKSGGRSGDVKPAQNNFAGLGATGKGAPGESFPDVTTGVRAHLEHLLIYSGQHLDNPVAERTRKVQEWGVLTQWQAGFSRPITFADLAAKWAPGSNAYSKMMEGLAQNFQDFCRKPDPKPELLAAVRKTRLASAEQPQERPGQVLARRAIETGKNEDNNRLLSLGAKDPVEPAAKAPPTPFKILNTPAGNDEVEQERPPVPLARVQPQPIATAPAQPGENSTAFRSGMLNMPPRQAPNAARAEPQPPAAQQPAPVAQAPAAQAPVAQAPVAQAPVAQAPVAQAPAAQPPATPTVQAKTTTPARKEIKVASAATAARPGADPVGPGQKCRVWTASYGGQKALIIRSVIDKVINFTVLDVNEGAEKREADAFIAAYAKNGAVTGEFTSQTIALDKAFELCPEG